MNRRRVLQMMAIPAPGALFNGLDILLAAAEPVEPAGEATPALLAHPQLRFGCSFHFGMPNFTGDDYDVGGLRRARTVQETSMCGSGSG